MLTITAVAVVALPAASRATADIACGPFGTVELFHWIVNGAAVSGAPTAASSTVNCTAATPTSSLAVAETGIVPDIVPPTARAVIATAGAGRAPSTNATTS